MKIKKENQWKLLFFPALILIMLVTSSLAWRDLTQHKTNKFTTKSIASSVILVEDFKPIEKWTEGQSYKKEIFVRNGQETDDTSKFTFSDGYVRLQLREFLGLAKQDIDYHPKRLMIDTEGNFYRFKYKEDAVESAEKLNISPKKIVEVKGVNDDQKYFYFETGENDTNGVYGKFLVKSINSGPLTSLKDGSIVTVDDLDKDTKSKHNSVNNSNIEDSSKFSTHLWIENQEGYTPLDNKYSEYVKWSLGDDVISLNEWKTIYQSRLVDKWIIDTEDSVNGYVYWGQKLEHSNTLDETSVTSNLLEKVTLIKQPESHAEYRIHVNMDAVSFDDLNLWTDGNHEIIDALKDNGEKDDLLEKLKLTIEMGEKSDLVGKTNESVKELQLSLEHGKRVYELRGPSNKDIINAIERILNAIAGLEDSLVDELKNLINLGKKETKYFKNVRKWDYLINSIEFAEDILSKEDYLEFDVIESYTQLAEAYEPFRLGEAEAKIGEQLYMSDRVFTLVKYGTNKDEALILSKQLSYHDYEVMDKEDLVNEYGFISFYQGSWSGTPYNGYEGSNVQLIDQSFYTTFIQESKDANRVKPVVIEQEPQPTDLISWDKRNDKPTYVDLIKGEKTAFSLAISDLNASSYGSSIDPEYLKSDFYVWLRSPGEQIYVSFLSEYGRQSFDSLQHRYAVRPALWVTMP